MRDNYVILENEKITLIFKANREQEITKDKVVWKLVYKEGDADNVRINEPILSENIISHFVLIEVMRELKLYVIDREFKEKEKKHIFLEEVCDEQF